MRCNGFSTLKKDICISLWEINRTAWFSNLVRFHLFLYNSEHILLFQAGKSAYISTERIWQNRFLWRNVLKSTQSFPFQPRNLEHNFCSNIVLERTCRLWVFNDAKVWTIWCKLKQNMWFEINIQHINCLKCSLELCDANKILINTIA